MKIRATLCSIFCCFSSYRYLHMLEECGRESNRRKEELYNLINEFAEIGILEGKMTDINRNLRSDLLPAAMVIKEFVQGDENCDYEKYLLEIVNASVFFKSLSNGKEYVAPRDESHGEDDADSGEYSLDFKLVESSSYLEAQSQFSARIEIIMPGVKTIVQSKKRGHTTAVYLHCALREITTLEQIEDILNTNVRYIRIDERKEENLEEQIKADLKSYFNVLGKNKNLLLFIPEIFSFENKSYELSEAIEIIKDALSIDYLLSLKYRNNKVADKDTYLTCIYDRHFLVYKYEEGKLVFKDIVSYMKSKSFMELFNDYGTHFW